MLINNKEYDELKLQLYFQKYNLEFEKYIPLIKLFNKS